MRVLYDYQAFTLQRIGGVSRYFAELIQHLQHNPQFEVSHGVVRTSNEHFLDAFPAERRRASHRWDSEGAGAFLRIANKSKSIAHLWLRRCDLFHPTYFSSYFLPYLRDVPYVLTVFDMIHELFEEELPSSEKPVGQRKRLLSERAAQVIAISASTKNDLVRLFNLAPEKIAVVPLANSLSDSNAGNLPSEFPEKFLLFVGKRSGYKNFPCFVKAVAPLTRRDRTLHVICSGGRNFTGEEIQLLGQLGIAQRVIHIDASDRLLAALYRHARAFVFPSRYEGFGIPILEAFACGCPVAASNVSSLPEVGGDAAVYFDPDNEVSITEALALILEDPTFADSLRKKGKMRNTLFSWESTTRMTADIYHHIAPGK